MPVCYSRHLLLRTVTSLKLLNACCAQVGGQQSRWQLYHHLYLIEHSGKRTTPVVKGPTALNPQDKRPPSIPPLRQDHPLTEHVDWMLPTLLRVCTCLHAVWTPEV